MSWLTGKRHEREVALQDGAEEIDFEVERLLKFATGGAALLKLGVIAFVASAVFHQR